MTNNPDDEELGPFESADDLIAALRAPDTQVAPSPPPCIGFANGCHCPGCMGTLDERYGPARPPVAPDSLVARLRDEAWAKKQAARIAELETRLERTSKEAMAMLNEQSRLTDAARTRAEAAETRLELLQQAADAMRATYPERAASLDGREAIAAYDAVRKG